MADNQPKLPPLQPPTGEFPETNFPVVFVDGAWSLVNNSHIVKIYLARLDPNYAGTGVSKANPAVQLVLPIDGFVNLVAFLDAQLGTLIARGTVTNEQLEKAREPYRQKTTP
jgi:hypothetical protein